MSGILQEWHKSKLLVNSISIFKVLIAKKYKTLEWNKLTTHQVLNKNIYTAMPAQPKNSRKLTFAKVVARSSTSDKDPIPAPWNEK